MKSNTPALWRFFASVKLALVSLFILAATSVIGTLIPQKNPPEFYIENFGPGLAQFFFLLDVPDMYSSRWFVALLLLFCVNLIVCSIDRLPNVWRMVVMNNLETPVAQLEKMPNRQEFQVSVESPAVADLIAEQLREAGWQSKASDDRSIHFAQKGPWTRLGVYAVHLSILVIFAGAFIGAVTGFKASVMITEGSDTEVAYETGTGKPIPLGFSVRCDDFNLSYYGDGGTPKEFRSMLTIDDQKAQKKFSRAIIVNDPLTYKGITFYQSSYEPLQGFAVNITNKTDKSSFPAQIPFGEKIPWVGTDIEFGIINLETWGKMGNVVKMKFWFSDGKSEPTTFWLNNNATTTISRPTGEYEIQAGQLFATGLQVAKDPGVWTVYLGCSLMLIGLYVAFFLSHRRIWLAISQAGPGRCRVLLCGNSNKNKPAFEKEFAALSERLAEKLPTTSKEQQS